ncbi:unnamed protein product [Phytophthora lilii]|uniref:Unnamed protein product n=1 Tax=Phytophthora lilii TaxID=2077276 RepID=A0A9W6WSE9_9STRA|nr:unnamed protein product [Phytophthora lilii]
MARSIQPEHRLANRRMHFRTERVVRDYRSLNTGAKVPEPAIDAVKVKPEFLQHPLPANLQKQLDDYVKAGFFRLGPSAIPSLVDQAVASSRSEETAVVGEDATVSVVSAAQFEKKVQAHEYAELFHVTVKTSPKVTTVPPQLQAVLDEYADVFPDELPLELPPHRSIVHEVVLKPGVKPSNRALFRLSKVEQAALELFVADLLKKNWIQVSDSPWVSNIFWGSQEGSCYWEVPVTVGVVTLGGPSHADPVGDRLSTCQRCI